jgi:S1-C subfamily serine protease
MIANLLIGFVTLVGFSLIGCFVPCTTGLGTGYAQKGDELAFPFGPTGDEANKNVCKEPDAAGAWPDLPPVSARKEGRQEKGYSTGTGFFITTDGYVLTSYHAVKEGNKVVIITQEEEKEVAARIVQVDPDHDVALLKADIVSLPLLISPASGLLKGDEVFTLGYPLVIIQGRAQKANFGRVNALSGVKDDIRYLQIDVPMQPGNSGGPLIDKRGKVVGIVAAALDQVKTFRLSGMLPQTVNYALKSDYILPMIRRFVQEDQEGADGRFIDIPQWIKANEASVVLVISR